MNTVKAIFYSPLAIVAIVLLFSVLIVGLQFYLLMIISLTTYLIGLTGIIIFGIPTYFILNRLHVTNGIPYILVGFLAPIVITGIMSLSKSPSISGILVTSFIPAILGAICAYAFWCCAVYQALSIKH